MSTLDKDRYHRAARDGFLDLLNDATRKDCNALDEDGITPTIWAAYYGQLEALRTLVGRGGDPDRCDYTGNTALHWSAKNGHFNCVSFLVNFGVNLWALNNEFQTAKDLAALEERTDILAFMDQVMAKQSALNPKVVQKLKEKAISDAEKRIKNYEKLHKKASKKAEREEKHLLKQRKRLLEPIASLTATLKRDTVLAALPANTNTSSFKFSEIVNNGTMTSTKVKGFGGVSRKVQLKKQLTDTMSTNSDFKVRETLSNGPNSKSSVRSLTGLRRDNEILYVRKYQQITNNNTNNSSNNNNVNESDCKSAPEVELRNENYNCRPHLRDLFKSGFDDNLTSKKCTLMRTFSEPDFMSHFADSGIGDDIVTPPESSIFERPGFGSVAFRKNSLVENGIIPMNCKKSAAIHETEIESSNGVSQKSNSNNNKVSEKYSKNESGSGGGSDSIGSAGSLAQRNATMSVMSTHANWDEEEDALLDEVDDAVEKMMVRSSTTPPIILFLAANSVTEYMPLFQKEKIDLEALMLLNEDDLKSLGLPLGPRRKIMRAIEKRKIVQQDPGCIRDTSL
ncbi:Usher syndrome type-1G protein-like protein [Dinothrombium tinctorium]|uniref:Usher syndrome type-1G protein-like protein n=1 Tax=Dinothrombium tinctorium TaxID=1965070 RepID=A0A3S4QS81_9ACAR|nr:Usher syndrome type-1G protein-like protein [Dinothrombium tinctorium]RWS07095.1 Usher syndrome type-1G protein-like protein [Dinothrombium tinctorium]